MKLNKIAPLILALFAFGAHADEASVRKSAEAFFGPQIKIDGVRKLPQAGLYEIRAGEYIGYTDEQVSFMLFGDMWDTKTKQNLTQQRLAQLSTINFKDLPLDIAIKQVRGKGTRVIATFEDPNCGYCKKLAHDMRDVTDITIYTFLIPILGPDSKTKAETIWCAPDRSKAWKDWMLSGTLPPVKTCDLSGLQKSVELGAKYRVQGTPTIFLSSGERIGGAIPADQLEKRMNLLVQGK